MKKFFNYLLVFVFCFLLSQNSLSQESKDSNSSTSELGTESNPYELKPSRNTVVWGYYWSETKPVLHIKSGDIVKVHTLLTSNPIELERIGISPDEIEQELKDVQSVTKM